MRIGTLTSNAVGLVFSLLVGILVGAIVSALFLAITGLSYDFWYVGFWIPGIIAGYSFFSAGQQPKVAIGNCAIPKLLDQRLTGLRLTEGTHWLPPGIMSLDPMDMRVTTTKVLEVKALSSDNVLMTGMIFYTFNVNDPIKNQNAKDPEESLIKFGEGELRSEIAHHDSEHLEEPETWNGVRDHVIAAMAQHGDILGYSVTGAKISEILPPESIINAAAKRRVELEEGASEKVERDTLKTWVAELGELGIKPELALETAQVERGKKTASQHTFRLEGAQAIADAIASAIVQAVGKGAAK